MGSKLIPKNAKQFYYTVLHKRIHFFIAIYATWIVVLSPQMQKGWVSILMKKLCIPRYINQTSQFYHQVGKRKLWHTNPLLFIYYRFERDERLEVLRSEWSFFHIASRFWKHFNGLTCSNHPKRRKKDSALQLQ